MSIRARGLSKKYGTQTAVNAIDFSINTGEVVGFLGPNGAGKSTTMRMLTCYLPPSSGDAEVQGLNVLNSPEKVKRLVGYLPEHNPLYPEMYVREYLHFVADLSGWKGDRKKRVEEIVDLTGLRREVNKRIQQLSKGYRQRVGLAQALIHDPQVLILDEPTSGLDPNQVVEIRKLITEIGKDKTVLLSTHIMQEVEAMCDRVVIIDRGNIVADSNLEELQKEYGGNAHFVRFKKQIDAQQLVEIEGVESTESVGKGEYRLRHSIPGDIEEKLFAWAVEHNNVLLEQRAEKQNLEQIFRTLTNGNNG